jgi:hypothetical protein
MDSQKQRDVRETLKSMAANEFIPPETLDEFIHKHDGSFRPHKKIFFERKPDSQDRRDLLHQYLREIRDREKGKLDRKKEDVDEEQLKLKQIAEEIKKDLDKDKEAKKSKIQKMRSNVAEVRAEREAADASELEYRMK